MSLSRRAIVKGAIALLVGVPVTVVFLPAAGLVVLVGAFNLINGPGEEMVQSSFHILWGVAGLVGVCGFWAWVFSSGAMSKKRRVITATCVFVGVCAVAPMVLMPVYGGFAALSCAGGILICLWLVLPKLPLNPDARQERPRAG